MNENRQTAKVILFKPSGKYYTEEHWRIPTPEEAQRCEGFLPGDMMMPYVMRHSPDFHRVSGKGAVLVPTQEPWGYPHLIPAVADEESIEINRLELEVARIRKDSRRLAALEAAGVDNWEGYSNAFVDEEDEGDL